jgi:hypothetical protein
VEKIEKSEFSAGGCNFDFQRHKHRLIPTATPTTLTTTDLNITMLTSSDVADSRFKMTATEQEVEM